MTKRPVLTFVLAHDGRLVSVARNGMTMGLRSTEIRVHDPSVIGTEWWNRAVLTRLEPGGRVVMA